MTRAGNAGRRIATAMGGWWAGTARVRAAVRAVVRVGAVTAHAVSTLQGVPQPPAPTIPTTGREVVASARRTEPARQQQVEWARWELHRRAERARRRDDREQPVPGLDPRARNDRGPRGRFDGLGR